MLPLSRGSKEASLSPSDLFSGRGYMSWSGTSLLLSSFYRIRREGRGTN